MRRTALRALLALTLLVGLLPAVSAASAGAAAESHSENLQHIKNLSYEAKNGGTPNYGTDIEFAELGGREYALAGSYKNGLQIVDITDPENAAIVSTYDCGITQGDVQVFQREDYPGRTFVTYTSDTFGDGTSTCYQEAAALGFETTKTSTSVGTGGVRSGTSGRNGTFIADITDPLNPVTVSFVEVKKGSHNQTVHPSGLFLYNSNSDLITSAGTQGIEVYDISDFLAPKLATKLALPLRPGLGTESHDITFNDEGTRAYSAALSQTVIINTENPAEPSIVSSFVDPSINVEHQADPFSLTDASGKTRDFVIVEDEYAGAAGGPHCPSGGVHVFETTGALERNPQKVGYWNISDAGLTPQPTGRCTAHVFDIHEDEAIMTIAFYNGGVRVVDISGLTGISLGSTEITPNAGMKELAFYKFDNSDTWAAKTPKINRHGDFYLYGNDVNRGLDIFKFDAGNKPGKPEKPGKPGKAEKNPKASQNQGTWMTPAQAAATLPRMNLAAEAYKPFCLLPQ